MKQTSLLHNSLWILYETKLIFGLNPLILDMFSKNGVTNP